MEGHVAGPAVGVGPVTAAPLTGAVLCRPGRIMPTGAALCRPAGQLNKEFAGKEGLRSMGLFYTTFTTYGPDAAKVVAALKKLRRSAFVSATVERHTVVYDQKTE